MRHIALAVMLAITLSACHADVAPTATPTATARPVVIHLATPTPTAVPTVTPVPTDTPAPVPTDTPTVAPTDVLTMAPASAPVSTQVPEDAATFATRYKAMNAAYQLLGAHLASGATILSPGWRAEALRLTQKWRDTLDALSATPQPVGDKWAAAWPTLTQALQTWASAATDIETAMNSNDTAPLWKAKSEIIEGVNLMNEVGKTLNGQ